MYAIAVSPTRVYVGGSFDAVKGKNRHRLAALGTSSAAPLAAWHPNANSTVRAIIVSPGGGRVFAGGDFTAVNGRSHPHLAAILTDDRRREPRTAPTRNWPVTTLRTTGKELVGGGGGNGGHVAV